VGNNDSNLYRYIVLLVFQDAFQMGDERTIFYGAKAQKKLKYK
jgi:hypothetical protein